MTATEESANRAMVQLTNASKGITEKVLQIPIPYCDQGGIQSDHLVSPLNSLTSARRPYDFGLDGRSE
jgi:hypothetical protein